MRNLTAPIRARMPPPLRPGDRVCVIAPSSPFDRTLVYRGLGWLKSRYHLEFSPGLFSRDGYLAGSDARRAKEFNAALRNPGISAIVAARGGFGLTRIAHELEWSALHAAPKWLVGFSDFTAAHVEVSRQGWASIHAHCVAGLGHGDAHARSNWLGALEKPDEYRHYTSTQTWRPGLAEGRLFGGNLTMLYTCAAADRLKVPQSSILVLEDIGESSYRIDRMLSALLAAGHFDHVAGIVIGNFSSCQSGKYRVPVADVLRSRLSTLGVPVISGLPFGHELPNEPLILGGLARIDGTRGQLQLGGITTVAHR